MFKNGQSRSKMSSRVFGLVALMIGFVVLSLTQTHMTNLYGEEILYHPTLSERSSLNPVEQFKASGKVVYWFGAKPGFSCNMENFSTDSILVSYLPEKSAKSETSQLHLTIETFQNAASFRDSLHPLLDPNGRELFMTENEIIEFNSSSMTFEIVILKTHQEIVVINYPDRQSETALIANAESLQRVIPD